MTRILLALLGLLSSAQAQITAPAVSITPILTPPVSLVLAQKVLIQPAKLETRLPPGYTTGILNVTLFSEVSTEVKVQASDPRLVLRGTEDGMVRLGAYNLQSLNFVALAAHTGTITVRNREGSVIANAPYVVASAKMVNQSASLNYSPATGRGSLSYSVSNNPVSVLDPRVSLNVGLNVTSGQLGGNVGINVSW